MVNKRKLWRSTWSIILIWSKNILPNCNQGKATAKRLWDELALKLNSYGPPTKDVKLWRKAFADQKFNAKKKMSFNKASKQKTGGGPYEEMILTSAEEQIIQATGVDLHVEGLSAVKTYGKPNVSNTSELDAAISENMQSILEDDGSEDINDYVEKEKPRSYAKKEKDSKMSILSSHVVSTEDYQRELLSKTNQMLLLLNSHTQNMEEYKQEQNQILERLIKIKERSLNIREEEHKTNMEIKQVELEIKKLQLQLLQ